MFSRSKKQQLPSYIEGTQGRYVRRASPPPVPSLTSHSIVKRATISGADLKPTSSYARPETKPASLSISNNLPTEAVISQSQPVVIPADQNQSTPATQEVGSPSDSAEGSPRRLSVGFLPTDPSISTSSLFNNNNNNNSSHTNRHLLVHQQRFDQGDGKRSPIPGALSSHSFNDPRREHHRKPLTTSHSIGNVESFMDQLDPALSQPPEHQQRFVSLQSLPGRALGSSIIGDECLVSGSPQQDELPLPPNWAIEVTPEGLRYYVDHNTRRTHWIHPLANENLPVGWRKIFSEHSGVLYYNEINGHSQVEHPGFAPPISRTESMLVASRRAESAVEHLNIIQQEDVPEWLMMYAQADTGLDHLLEFDLFPTLQLEQFERMMRKLYKQEVIDTVRRYERMRTVINKEIVRRTQPRTPT